MESATRLAIRSSGASGSFTPTTAHVRSSTPISSRRPAALQQFRLPQALLQPFAAAAQRLADRLRRRGQAALQDGECVADRAGALVVGQRLGAVELLAHVVGDVPVEARLGRR
jgi:hypothetical protein